MTLKGTDIYCYDS
jgi:serine/threonine protein kinase